MSFFEHLEELRTRLIIMVAAVFVGSVVGWFVYGPLIGTLTKPLKSALAHHHNIVNTVIYPSLVGAFTLHIKLAIYTGVVLSLPILVWQIWGFVVPALPTRFYRYGPYVMVSGVILFVIGGITGYEIMPLAINFFVSQGSSTGQFLVEASGYISFVSLIIIIFGVSFELPLILVLLSVAGITSSGWLWRKRVIAFFIIFAAAAVITPGADWISPLVLGGILYVLFLVSIIIAKLVGH